MFYTLVCVPLKIPLPPSPLPMPLPTPGSLVEEQRALATLGRTFFVHSQSELEAKKRKEEVDNLLLKSVDYYLSSLEVCDRLLGGVVLSDRELLEMRSRLYLNLGLVYENQKDLQSARQFIEKALGIVK